VLSSAFFSLLFSFAFSLLWLALLCRACIDCSVLTLFDFFFNLKKNSAKVLEKFFFFFLVSEEGVRARSEEIMNAVSCVELGFTVACLWQMDGLLLNGAKKSLLSLIVRSF